MWAELICTRCQRPIPTASSFRCVFLEQPFARSDDDGSKHQSPRKATQASKQASAQNGKAETHISERRLQRLPLVLPRRLSLLQPLPLPDARLLVALPQPEELQEKAGPGDLHLAAVDDEGPVELLHLVAEREVGDVSEADAVEAAVAALGDLEGARRRGRDARVDVQGDGDEVLGGVEGHGGAGGGDGAGWLVSWLVGISRMEINGGCVGGRIRVCDVNRKKG